MGCHYLNTVNTVLIIRAGFWYLPGRQGPKIPGVGTRPTHHVSRTLGSQPTSQDGHDYQFHYLSEQGNKNLIGPNPIRQPGAREAYKGSLAPATS
jgi:hypothetical protein